VDLLETPIDYKAISLLEYPIVPVSALYNVNIDKLLQTIETRINDLKGK
jgi:translation initiation factor 2 gamma subunit (eIF-2gamma)